MPHVRRRLVALTISCAAAAAIFVVGWRWLEKRRVARLDLRVGERVDLRWQRPETTRGYDLKLDPVDPREWRFYLEQRRAERFFPRGNVKRYAYDPWTYIREVGGVYMKLKWPEHPDRQWIWHTNDLGCREDAKVSDPPPPLRVLIAGDSHACGLCNNSETFASHLERRIGGARGEPIEALNAALGGYTFFNYLGTLYRFRAFDPQVMVVTVFGGNDFAELLPLYLYFSGEEWRELDPQELVERTAGVKASPEAMGQGMAALHALKYWPEMSTRLVEVAAKLSAEIARAARVEGAEPVFVFIPSPFELRWPDPPTSIARAREALKLEERDFEVATRMADDFLARLRAEGMTAIDMRPAFAAEPKPPYWRCDFHLDLRGHELVAQALEPAISALLPESVPATAVSDQPVAR